jgi:tRNA 2-thiouridine synthesizing protein A
MAIQQMDFKGMKCPQPTLKLTTLAFKIPKGDVVEITADCPTFEKDMRDWCGRNKKIFLWIKDLGNGIKSCQIQF